MADAMAPWGQATGAPWLGQGAGIAGDPVAVASGSALVFASGRLDNRDELCAALRIDGRRRSSISTGELMAAAYERWADDAPRRILGDWALAAYHPAERRLVLARDHYGQTGLYYHHDGSSFALASTLNGLLALPHVPRRLNELHLAQHLAAWPADGAATLYEGVQRLPPAHVLTVDAGAVRTQEYWRPEDAPDVRLSSDSAYAEQFVELFAAAVRTRLPPDGPAGCTLSAGLDSSAVTALAARDATARGRGLTALTAVPAYPEVARALPDALVDEWDGAALVAAAHPGVEHVRVTGRNVTPLEANARAHNIHGEIPGSAPNRPWMLALLAEAQRRGLSVVLTGQAGNGGVSWPGEEGVALRRLLAGDPRGALQAVVARRRAGAGWPLAVRRELGGPAKRRLAGELTRRRRRSLGGSLVAPSLAARVGLVERMRANGFDSWRAPATAEERRLATLLPGLTPVGAIWRELGAAYGLDVRDPTADVRLLEFCFGIPPEQFIHGAQDRWLIRRALEGLVPPEVLWNRRRGVQGADLAFRLRADAAAVAAALERAEGSELVRSCLDMEGLRVAWETVRGDSDGAAPAAATHVIAGLDAAMFLRRF